MRDLSIIRGHKTPEEILELRTEDWPVRYMQND